MDWFVFFAVLFAAACHAGWNASIKKTLDPLATTVLIALGAGAVALVFVPCRGGISHNEAEFSSKEQCAKGAQVLLQAVLDYDRMLAERGGAAKGAR